jgi:hypothetical protein
VPGSVESFLVLAGGHVEIIEAVIAEFYKRSASAPLATFCDISVISVQDWLSCNLGFR